jgi:hypothetical protein
MSLLDTPLDIAVVTERFPQEAARALMTFGYEVEPVWLYRAEPVTEQLSYDSLHAFGPRQWTIKLVASVEGRQEIFDIDPMPAELLQELAVLLDTEAGIHRRWEDLTEADNSEELDALLLTVPKEEMAHNMPFALVKALSAINKSADQEASEFIDDAPIENESDEIADGNERLTGIVIAEDPAEEDPQDLF